eukprot:SM000184S03764  [mRNA]  locus=s184:86963:89444:- [translate_table: standard]
MAAAFPPAPGPHGSLCAVGRTEALFSTVWLAHHSLLKVMAFPALAAWRHCAGTVIEQGESADYYAARYPDGGGLVTAAAIRVLALDHIYSAPYFVGLLALLAASLAACTATRQLPMTKAARRWAFARSPEGIAKLDFADVLPGGRVQDLATLLSVEGFEVFVQGGALYAFRGLAGRLAPIGVHAALLVTMAGCTLSALGGFQGTSMTPQGLDFFLGDALVPNGPLSSSSPGLMDLRLFVNRFYIDYRPTGEVEQFHSDLALVSLDGAEVLSKTISVNDPLRYGGVTVYQTDWAISAIQVRVGDGSLRLPMANLQPGSDLKLFGTFLPLEGGSQAKPHGLSILARDLQSVVVYDSKGDFVGVRRAGSQKPLTVDGATIVIEDIIGSTGLELKMDPGVPLVYAGFGGLMLTTCISYLSHSQVWALQQGGMLHVGGKSNRAKLTFRRDLDVLLDLVPEVASHGPEKSVQDEDDRCEALAVVEKHG